MKKSTTNKVLISLILFFIISLMTPALLFSGEMIIRSDDQFRFARQYMTKGEYSRAIGEFDRFIYFFPDDKKVPEVRYLIGVCYLKQEKYEKAREVFNSVSKEYSGTNLAEKAILLTGESYYRQGLPKEAETYFKKIITDYPVSELTEEALYRLGWIGLKTYRWQEASRVFSSIESSSPLYIHSLDLAQRALRGEDLPYKDPKVAGLMAGVVPGLGHVYCHRYRDGMVALLLNGLFIWAASEAFEEDQDVLGGILCFFEAGWYAGNIYSAVNSAHKFNRKKREDFIRGLPDNFNLDLFASKGNRVGLALKITF